MPGKLLITGGFGNLGSWLSEYFSNQGYEVYILSKRTRDLQGVNYQTIQADISDLDALQQKLTESFDYCIHTASSNEFFKEGYAKDALMINTLGTRNLVDVLKDKGLKKFIYFSTFHVYGNSEQRITEESPLHPRNDYASTHLFAEYYLKQFYQIHQFPYLTVRLTNSYGAPKYVDSTKWYLVLNDLVKSAYEQQKIVMTSNGQASRDFIWMGDVCEVTKKLLEVDAIDETFNLSADQNFKVIDLAQMVQTVYEKRYKKEIELSINRNDQSTYQPITVSNRKLLQTVKHQFGNHLETETHKIFDLLERDL